MRFLTVLFILILTLANIGVAQPIGDVSLGQIIGSSADDSVGIGPLTFNFKYSIDSTSEVVTGFTNGFKIYSPDGATWENLYGDTINSLGLFSYNVSGIENYSIDGLEYDTVGFWGVFWDTAALDPGYSQEIISINLELQIDDYGKTICIDSSFYGNSGFWMWSAGSNNSNAPSWGGPYCFPIGVFMDLSLSGVDITLSPTIPNEDQETQISVVVRNNSYETASNFIVEVATDSNFVSLIDVPIFISELPGGVDTTVEFSWIAVAGVDKIYARVDGNSSVIEYDENNNDGRRSIYVIPFSGLTASINQPEVSAELGDTLQFQIEINNRTVLEHYVEVAVSGLENYAWTLTDDTVNMLAGELAYVRLNVVIDGNCAADTGLVNFDVLLTAIDDPSVNTTTSGIIHISNLPIFSSLLPEIGQTLATNTVTFMWKTKTESTSKVYYKKINDQDFAIATGADAIFHSVLVADLDFDAEYVWFAESQTNCGISSSDTISFKTGHGVTFSQNSYSYTIRRSYDQRATLQINNTDSFPHEVLVEVINPYDDLILGFVGDGSIDQVVELGAGSNLTIDLGIHAQDAEKEDYAIAFRLISTAADNSKLYDYANVNIHVNWPDTNFTLTDLGKNPYNLIQTMRLYNLGDSITDFKVEMDNEVGVNYMINPEIGHAILAPNRYLDFELTPIFQDVGATCNATVIATGAGKTLTYDLTECCDKQLFFVEEPNAMICLDHGVNSWYCTNRPSVNMSFTVPYIGTGTVNSGKISMEFMPYIGNIKPHDIRLYLNGHLIGELIQTNPLGVLEFNFDPAFLISSSGGPARNILRIEGENFNGGHYAIKTNMSMCLCVTDYGEYICANTFEEAEDILQSKPYFFQSTPTSISINEPSEGATIQKLTTNSLVVDVQPAHKRYTVVADVVFTGGTTQQIELSYNDEGQVYYTNWLPDECENATITITATNCDETLTSSAVNVVIDVGNCSTPTGYGTTVIVHGWTPSPFGLGGWVQEMAEKVIDRLGKGILYRIVDGKIEVAEGEYDSLDFEGNGEKVIIFDWLSDSDLDKVGYLEAAADALAAVLIEYNGIKWNLDQLHFIGHSRGALVCSEVIERLGLYNSSENLGIDSAIHLTTLDPHPWEGIPDDCIGSIGSADDYDINSDNIVSATGESGQGNIRQAVVCWENVGFADNYFQGECDDFPHLIPTGLHSYIGLNDIDSANLNLDDIWTIDPEGNNHSAVHDWYLGTIIGNGSADFYPNEECKTKGFNIGKNFANINDFSVANKTNILDDKTLVLEETPLVLKIFNGDFSMKRSQFTNKIPGWGFHGGGGGGNIDETDDNYYLELNWGDTWKKHNTLYIPENAVTIEFWAHVTNSGGGDQLEFRIGDDLIKVFSPIGEGIAYAGDFWRVDIPTQYRGTSQTIEFRLEDPDFGIVNSEIWIDNIEFDIDDQSSLLIAKFSPVDLLVTDPNGDTLSNTVAKIEMSTYDSYEVAPGDSIAVLKIKSPINQGSYNIKVIPWATATPSDQYSIVVYYYDDSTIIADNEIIANIPDTGYQYLFNYCCVPPIRGNVDGILPDAIDISDLVFMVAYSFQGGAEPPCMDEADINGSGEFDISDIVFLVDYMFQGGAAPALCP